MVPGGEPGSERCHKLWSHSFMECFVYVTWVQNVLLPSPFGLSVFINNGPHEAPTGPVLKQGKPRAMLAGPPFTGPPQRGRVVTANEKLKELCVLVEGELLSQYINCPVSNCPGSHSTAAHYPGLVYLPWQRRADGEKGEYKNLWLCSLRGETSYSDIVSQTFQKKSINS